MRVLVVEDEAPLRELLCEALEAEGFVVVAAADGIEALEIVRGGARVDVLVLDDDMPRLRGLQLLRSLRADGWRVPAVFVSGTLELTESVRAELDVGSVLRKPVRLEQLADAVREAGKKQGAT